MTVFQMVLWLILPNDVCYNLDDDDHDHDHDDDDDDDAPRASTLRDGVADGRVPRAARGKAVQVDIRLTLG